MRKHFVLTCIALVSAACGLAENYELQKYTYPTPYAVEKIQSPTGKVVKNVILMIGDGMSLAHIQSAWTCNRGKLWLENAPYVGLSKTPIVNRLIADSGSGGTALATGYKTIYHAIGVDGDGAAHPSLINLAHDKGLSTGVVVTCRLWDATPCTFLAHNVDRDEEELLVEQFPDSPVDYVFGGGARKMKPEGRFDKRDIFGELKDKGYSIVPSYEDFLQYKGGKAWCVPFDVDTPLPAERKDMLAKASLKQIDLLSKNKNGFFIMIEGSQLDDYGHFNQIGLLMEETLDFDQTIGEIYKWAAQDGETLVIVTADHETGGLSLLGGSLNTGSVEVKFSTDDHSGTMVPIYAFGPGSENFSGFMDQKEIFRKVKHLLGL